MKVFLLQMVPGLGAKGEIKEVTEGYARNFLFPRKLGIPGDAANAADIQGRSAQLKQQETAEKKRRTALSDKIESLKLAFDAKARPTGDLYGSIGAAEIREQLSTHGISIDDNQVLLEKPYKKTGSYSVAIRLSSQLQPMLKVKITAS